jgi:hypothetical protein
MQHLEQVFQELRAAYYTWQGESRRVGGAFPHFWLLKPEMRPVPGKSA